MSDPTTNPPQTPPSAPLGVGAIVGESFSILFGNFLKVMILGFVPTLLSLLISGVLIGWGATLGMADPGLIAPAAITGFIISLIAQVGLYGLTIGLLVLFAYDAKQGRTHPLMSYVNPALRSAFPIAILAIVAGIATGLASLALIIPGLWVYAVFSVFVPAVVVDRAGFGALGRSAQLTKGYRWPIVGTVVIIGICTFVLSFVANFIAGLVDTVGLGTPISVVVAALVNAAVYGLSGISVALIYARLREIKEGVGIDDLAAVFD